MNTRVLFALGCLTLVVPVAAQFGPAESTGGLEFTVDSAQFMGEENTLVELYYQVPNSELLFQANDEETGPWWATYVVRLELLNDRGQVIYRKSWSNDVQAVSKRQAEATESYSLDTSGFEIEPGLYEARVTIGDPNSEAKQTGEVLLPLEVESFVTPDISLLQMASNARTIDEAALTTRPIVEPGIYYGAGSNTAAPEIGEDGFLGDDSFIKLGFFVAPRPDRSLNNQSVTMLFVYGEAYTLLGDYELGYEVYNAPGALVSSETKTVSTTGFDGLMLALDVSDWEKSAYELELYLADSSGAELARRTLSFDIGGAEASAEPIEVASTGEVMTDTELAQTLREIAFIATERELGDLASAPPDKRWLLVERFWEKRDPDPNTPVNEVKIEYYNRLAYVRNHFATGYGDGLDTDRGRIYMIFGSPDETTENPMGSGMLVENPTESGIGELESGLNITGTKGVNTAGVGGESMDTEDQISGEFMSNLMDLEKAHLLWVYYRAGGEGNIMKFLFQDRTGYGDYDIIWSTERGQY